MTRASREAAQKRLDAIQAELLRLEQERQELEEKVEVPVVDDNWPKRVAVWLHNEKWDEDVVAFAEDVCGFPTDSREMKNIAYVAYEVKLLYDVNKDGSYHLVGAEDGDDRIGDTQGD
jgi:hypothetical protein